MTYDIFKEQLKKDLLLKLECLDINVRITGSKVEKVNESYDALAVSTKDSGLGININTEKNFAALEGGKPYAEILNETVEILRNFFEQSPDFDVNELYDYSRMKNKLVTDVVSAAANEQLLKQIPHREIEDMAVVYRFELGRNGYGKASILITNKMIESMQISAAQLHEDALENSPKLRPVVFTNLKQIVAQMMDMSGEILPEKGFSEENTDCEIYVASVPDKVRGAGILAYRDFMSRASEKAGGSFYILPSSIHELIIVPERAAPCLSELSAMVTSVNASEVDAADKLTDNVYHYDCSAKIFETGEKYRCRIEERQ